MISFDGLTYNDILDLQFEFINADISIDNDISWKDRLLCNYKEKPLDYHITNRLISEEYVFYSPVDFAQYINIESLRYEFKKYHFDNFKEAFLEDIEGVLDSEDYEYFENMNWTGYYILFILFSEYSKKKPIAMLGKIYQKSLKIDSYKIDGLYTRNTIESSKNHIYTNHSVFILLENIKNRLNKYGYTYINNKGIDIVKSIDGEVKGFNEKGERLDNILPSCIALFKFNYSILYAISHIAEFDNLIKDNSPYRLFIKTNESPNKKIEVKIINDKKVCINGNEYSLKELHIDIQIAVKQLYLMKTNNIIITDEYGRDLLKRDNMMLDLRTDLYIKPPKKDKKGRIIKKQSIECIKNTDDGIKNGGCRCYSGIETLSKKSTLYINGNNVVKFDITGSAPNHTRFANGLNMISKQDRIDIVNSIENNYGLSLQLRLKIFKSCWNKLHYSRPSKKSMEVKIIREIYKCRYKNITEYLRNSVRPIIDYVYDMMSDIIPLSFREYTKYESNIIRTVLDECTDAGIVAVTKHDEIAVEEHNEKALQEIWDRVSYEIYGTELSHGVSKDENNIVIPFEFRQSPKRYMNVNYCKYKDKWIAFNTEPKLIGKTQKELKDKIKTGEYVNTDIMFLTRNKKHQRHCGAYYLLEELKGTKQGVVSQWENLSVFIDDIRTMGFNHNIHKIKLLNKSMFYGPSNIEFVDKNCLCIDEL